MTLKQLALKSFDISLLHNLWSIFVRYKKTFDHFDFYVSIILADKILKRIEIPLTINPISSHIEDNDPLQLYICFMHVYSLLFALYSLYRFTSFDELDTQSSFSSVRHLYFTKISLCLVRFHSNHSSHPDIRDSEITVDSDIFYHVHLLYFSVQNYSRHDDYHNLLHYGGYLKNG